MRYFRMGDEVDCCFHCEKNWTYLSGLVTLALLMWKWISLFLNISHLLRCWYSSKYEFSFFVWIFFLLRLLFISVNIHCYHIWTNAPCGYLNWPDKAQKLVCRTVGPSTAAFSDPLAHCWNKTNVSRLYMYYFGENSSKLVELVPFHFSVTITRCYKDVFVNNFLP